MNAERNRLAVLGSPISHSKSPQLHRAAYTTLGLPWHYDAVEVASDGLPAFLSSRNDEWRGLSLTMPLKRTVLPLLESLDDTARRTGAANTVLFDGSSGVLALRGFNTDVYGIVEAFHAGGVNRLSTVALLGSGATAVSALLAVSTLGADHVVVIARTPAHAAALERLAAELGVFLDLSLLEAGCRHLVVDAIISTIPGGADSGVSFSTETMTHSVLFEVAYDPWPTPLVSSWLASGGAVISGRDMLLYQALAQVRIFVTGDPTVALPDESAVLEAMRRSTSAD